MHIFKVITDMFYNSKDYGVKIETKNTSSYWCSACKRAYPEKKLIYVTYNNGGVQESVCLCRKCYKKAMRGTKK